MEYRTLARDDGWLSNAFERETVTISVHEDVRNDERAYYQACEAGLQKIPRGDRIGAKCTMGRALISRRSIPGGLIGGVFETRFDPAGCFLNDFLTSVRPPKAP